MDTRKQIILCLAWLTLKPGDTELARYCESILKSPAINVCQNSTATGRNIYIDSSGVPRQETAVCKCDLTYDTEFLTVQYSSNSSNQDNDITFEINKQPINTSTISEQTFTSKPIALRFNKSTADDIAVCLGINIVSPAIFNMTITCYPNNDVYASTTESRANEESTLPSVSTVEQGNGPTRNSHRTTVENVSEADRRKSEQADEKTHSSDTNIGVIAGAAGGGCVAVVLVVLIIVACKRKRNQRQSNTRGSPQLSNKPNEEPDYDMTENAMYNCDEDLTSKFSAKTPTLHDAQDDYATVSKTNDTENVYDVTNGRLANSPPNTGNVYNTLHQRSPPNNNTDEDVENQYDYTNNAKAMSRKQTDNVYDRTTS